MTQSSDFPARITIASRQSRLALWQAEYVKSALNALYPSMHIDILGLTTKGDQILDRPLAKVGGKGLFTKELERALEEGRADIAVHSMKDVPMQLSDGFCLAAILARENPADALVSNHYASLEDLPVGACVGTSSVRRAALLGARFPHLNVQSLRGNLDTRLAKLDAGEFDAILLAAAGLIRLRLAARIRMLLPPSDWLSAPGQGALGIEMYSDTVPTWLSALNDAPTAMCVQAERAFSNALNGSCQLPLGAYACLQQQNLSLRGFVASHDGARFLQDVICGAANNAQELGMQLAQKMRANGAVALLEAALTHE